MCCFSTHLRKSESVVLYEVLYYDDLDTVKQHLNAAPRSAIHQALSNPAHYLQVFHRSLSTGISPLIIYRYFSAHHLQVFLRSLSTGISRLIIYRYFSAHYLQVFLGSLSTGISLLIIYWYFSIHYLQVFLITAAKTMVQLRTEDEQADL